jgi:hypothetical protein
MRRRWLDMLLTCLLALQAGIVMPVSWVSAGSTLFTAPADCAEHTGSDSGDECPCCAASEGATSSGCASFCTTASLAPAEWHVALTAASVSAIPAFETVIATRTDAPPDPPPIV